MFYEDKPFSLTNMLIGQLPAELGFAGQAIKMLFNTQVFGAFMPEMKTYGNRKADLRCGFNKDYLEQGHLEQTSLSQIFLREGDKVEADLHFGCAVYVFDGDIGADLA